MTDDFLAIAGIILCVSALMGMGLAWGWKVYWVDARDEGRRNRDPELHWDAWEKAKVVRIGDSTIASAAPVFEFLRNQREIEVDIQCPRNYGAGWEKEDRPWRAWIRVKRKNHSNEKVESFGGMGKTPELAVFGAVHAMRERYRKDYGFWLDIESSLTKYWPEWDKESVS